ncbi:hypothetical protein BN12_1390005 [Nostocoides japonicum T1-X7]|uniref:Uncharacterized protein n=1 Tax=Nostocoides japonicum T1-X7 TaxID=1194083 RepID=A0A077LXN0_9MICO|nr:hypothetical protein BN12_1390005 [Tetrasphaera japonica T1-X7]
MIVTGPCSAARFAAETSRLNSRLVIVVPIISPSLCAYSRYLNRPSTPDRATGWGPVPGSASAVLT